MKKGITALFLSVLIVLGACGNADDIRNADEDLEAGEQVYRNNCASCHGADLSGNADYHWLMSARNIPRNKLQI